MFKEEGKRVTLTATSLLRGSSRWDSVTLPYWNTSRTFRLRTGSERNLPYLSHIFIARIRSWSIQWIVNIQ